MPEVRHEVVGTTLLITLDRPKANAVDVTTSLALYDAFARLRDDPALRVGVLTGTGRFFSAGWDLKAAAAGEAVNADHGPGGFAGLTELWDLDKPVIGAVNGLAVGGGFELALACDLLVAAEEARFALTEVTLGLVPDSGGLLRLPDRLPRALATELLLTGRWLDATEAGRWGLVNRVVPAGDVLRLAAEIAAGAPLAVAAVKAVLRATADRTRDGFVRMRGGEIPAYTRVLTSADAVEGAAAFADGRDPVWRGE